MAAVTSLCGIYDCSECQFVANGECPGCEEANRRLRGASEKACAILECVESHKIEACSQCDESSCLLRRSVESICPMRSRFESARWWAGRMSRSLEARRPAEPRTADAKIPPRVLSRLRLYLTALGHLSDEGASSVSSWQLAERVGVNAALIRKDLSRFGEFGTPSFGYRVDFLVQRIRGILGLDKSAKLVWIGAAHFGLHSAALARLEQSGCKVAAVLDADPSTVGHRVGGYDVLPIERLQETISSLGVRVAVLAVSGPQARKIADALVKSRVSAILNLSGELLVLPDTVRVSNVDPVGELLELCYYCGK